MAIAFKNELHDEFGTWPLAYIPYGGADFGEILAVGRAVGDGDDGAFHNAWISAGDRLVAEATECEENGRLSSARELCLRASAFYAASYHPLYGFPVDPRLLAAFRKQTEAFDRGLALSDPPVHALQIPFEGASMPAYLIPASGRADRVRPLLILTNGYDGTITDMYFASAVAASRRGYHCLLFDGPGQGAMLYEQGIHLRPDWETVVKPVVDFAVDFPCVDPSRMALSGWSLGGYLAPRGASGEPRLAACIADPARMGMVTSFGGFLAKLGISAAAASRPSELDEQTLDRIMEVISANRKLRWSIVQRGFWAHGVDNLRDYLRSAEQFTMEERIGAIACPTLVTQAEDDPLSEEASIFFDQLRCPKTLLHFSAAEGAGDHCEMGNRSLLNRRTLDWLDATLGVG
ncbi:alpha/beta fold hydrolase [Rhizobiaceae bacterium n13]|uniref:Alpha/beta fold hydrolase n=1 Tax=Ferirhizobium litorale TaxID=2927786 RepID=A0AAE3QCN2_9HYPH|nr:alpha/beta fold hydrolase [Fererhizobium litorale]MDI7860810.1 alpha/beta fold hydrolase [Fererhizobium litorale]MDI7920958.1 alpha/beta fold hydrolase [Fererhizobium litorale]